MVVSIIYRPPKAKLLPFRRGFDMHKAWLHRFAEQRGSNFIIVGDFNLPEPSPTKDHILNVNNPKLNCLVKVPTHINGNVLDLVLEAKNVNRVKNVEVEDETHEKEDEKTKKKSTFSLLNSDHFPIRFTYVAPVEEEGVIAWFRKLFCKRGHGYEQIE